MNAYIINVFPFLDSLIFWLFSNDTSFFSPFFVFPNVSHLNVHLFIFNDTCEMRRKMNNVFIANVRAVYVLMVVYKSYFAFSKFIFSLALCVCIWNGLAKLFTRFQHYHNDDQRNKKPVGKNDLPIKYRSIVQCTARWYSKNHVFYPHSSSYRRWNKKNWTTCSPLWLAL